MEKAAPKLACKASFVLQKRQILVSQLIETSVGCETKHIASAALRFELPVPR
jgi:hypothetical protein